MTEHQINKANKLTAERDDIQSLINFLSDDKQAPDFILEKKTSVAFLKTVPILRFTRRQAFSYATRNVIIDALCKRRNEITKQIEKL